MRSVHGWYPSTTTTSSSISDDYPDEAVFKKLKLDPIDNDDALTQVLVRDPVEGEVKWRLDTTIGGEDPTKLPLAGGTMSGSINMDGYSIRHGTSGGSLILVGGTLPGLPGDIKLQSDTSVFGHLSISDADVVPTVTPATNLMVLDGGEVKTVTVSQVVLPTAYAHYSQTDNPVETNITSSNTFTLMDGFPHVLHENQGGWTLNQQRLTYTGASTRSFKASYSISVERDTLFGSSNLSIAAFVNGTKVPGSEMNQQTSAATSRVPQSVSATCIFSLSTNDIFDIRIANTSGSQDVLISYVSVTLTQV